MRSILLTLAILVSSPAAAQWIFNGEDSAFGTGGTYLALTGDGLYAFGLRCDDDGLAAVYITPEDISSDEAAQSLALAPKMLLRVDSNPALELLTFIESANGKLRALSVPGVSFAEQVRDARTRVAVALSVGGSNYHERSFNAVGSTNAVRKLLEKCDTAE